jgi:hypothetical protein
MCFYIFNFPLQNATNRSSELDGTDTGHFVPCTYIFIMLASSPKRVHGGRYNGVS